MYYETKGWRGMKRAKRFSVVSLLNLSHRHLAAATRQCRIISLMKRKESSNPNSTAYMPHKSSSFIVFYIAIFYTMVLYTVYI